VFRLIFGHDQVAETADVAFRPRVHRRALLEVIVAGLEMTQRAVLRGIGIVEGQETFERRRAFEGRLERREQRGGKCGDRQATAQTPNHASREAIRAPRPRAPLRARRGLTKLSDGPSSAPDAEPTCRTDEASRRAWPAPPTSRARRTATGRRAGSPSPRAAADRPSRAAGRRRRGAAARTDWCGTRRTSGDRNCAGAAQSR